MGNIVICDQSALFFLMHCDSPSSIGAHKVSSSPLPNCASSSLELQSFNTQHPLFGGEPVHVLSNSRTNRPHTKSVTAHLVSRELPPSAFFEIRDELFIASPELVFARMANFVSEIELIEIGLNLCGRYYLSPKTEAINTRANYITSPNRIRAFLETTHNLRGSRTALHALEWVIQNSGSPFETKMKIQFCQPLRQGGFALPFNAMNYNISSSKLMGFSEQSTYCVDLAIPELKAGMEYDGAAYHQDSSSDKRRRNALKALGWDIFPIDKDVLMDPEATIRTGHQIAKALHRRLRKPPDWESRFEQLRRDLRLPI